MKDKKIKKKKSKKWLLLNIFLNVTILIVLGVFAWMLTNASSAENIEYTGRLLVTDNDVNVKLFVQTNNEYVEQSQLLADPIIQIKTMQPGDTQKYRLDIYNNSDITTSITKIVFSEVLGDIDLLKSVIQVKCTSPQLFTFKLEDRLEYDAVNEHYYFNFIDKLEIPANQMVSVYFNLYIDENATNQIQDTFLSIGKIMFINP